MEEERIAYTETPPSGNADTAQLLVQRWRQDSLGCLRKRGQGGDLFYLDRYYKLRTWSADSLLNLLGKPNLISDHGDSETWKYVCDTTFLCDSTSVYTNEMSSTIESFNILIHKDGSLSHIYYRIPNTCKG